jgi:RNA polymerase sigma factor (sigma-70 family)
MQRRAEPRDPGVSMFQTTRWSLVIAARGDGAEARPALEHICQTYRGPVLRYARRYARNLAEAEDLTQAFFVEFIEHAVHAGADPARGSFRAFLLTALRRFIGHVHEHDRALKRGGGQRLQPLDSGVIATLADDDEESPEQEFDRACALAVLERATTQLQEEAEGNGKGVLFQRLRDFLFEAPDIHDYRKIADELGLRTNTLAVTVHRLRERLRDLVRAELAHTVSSDVALNEELRAMRKVLGRH